jgi:DNA ligase-1
LFKTLSHPTFFNMQSFAQLFTQLDQTNKTNAKIAALVSFFEEAEDEDKLWAVALFSGKRPRRAVNTRLLREWAAEAAGIESWLFEESYHIVGDLAETIALLLPPPEEQSNKAFHTYLTDLIDLRVREEEVRKAYILDTWASLDSTSRFVFNKLLTGGWRIGVSQRLMVRALAKQTGLEANTIYHRLMGDWKPSQTTFQALLFSQNPNDDISRPYPFYLAYALEDEPHTLGNPDEWVAEWK